MALISSLKDQSLFVDQNYIDGRWTQSESKETFRVHDPATGDLIGTCPESTVADAEKAIAAAASSFPTWRSKSGRERSRVLRRWYELVLENKEDLATLITFENGKARADAAGEVIFAASYLEWYAEEAARIYGDVIPHSSSSYRVSVTKEPIGVCGLITPWNFPGGMITRKIAPALAAGCTVVAKTPGETPYTANALMVLGERAGVPKGVVNIVCSLRRTPEIGQVLCTSKTVKKISFTGSTRVGRLLMEQSSDTIKKMSLELGGNAPLIVFEDADLALALKDTTNAKFKSSGQTCVCANRIYVHRRVFDDFLHGLSEAVKRFSVGSGHDSKSTHGPLISAAAVDKVARLVDEAVSKGAKVITGGKKLASLGPNFYEPTILINVHDDMQIMQEEIFGPVATVTVFDDEEEVIDAANDCDVGLASYIFTQDIVRAQRVSERLDAGMVAINSGVVSDAATPFGGVKQSGLGREGSKYGIEDYMEIKTVVTGNTQVTHRARM